MSGTMSDDILTLAPPPADARISYGPDPNQFIDLRLPRPSGIAHKLRPLVMNIHGGFWRAPYDLTHAGHLCAALTAKGLATANVEYRRVGNNGGAWPGAFDDVRSAYNALVRNTEKHNFDRQRVLVMGHSAGGQLALCLAAHEPNLNYVVSLSGVVVLEAAYRLHLSNDAVVEFLRGTPEDVSEHYRQADPMQLPIPHVRQLLIHGSADDVVPPEFSRNYVTAKQNQNEEVRLIEIPQAGHFDLIDPRTGAWKIVEESILRLLG